MPRRRGARLAALPLLLLAGCNPVVLNPAGDVAVQQGDLVIVSTLLMLVIIVPVIALTIIFAWRYRASNKEATFDPDWDHSTMLELVIWSAPLLIIICLGAITWGSTHLLDPYRSIGRISPVQKVAANVRPLQVEVVALDWKWLFIYPEYGIATVNELAAPVNRPIQFKITASSVMNSFYIPALAGQIYAMPGMETRLQAVMNKPGNYLGFSANYSGAGFSEMNFHFYGLPQGDFDRWVAQVRGGNGALTRAAYLQLERPSENVPPIRYAAVAPNLFGAIVNMCVHPGKPCMSDQMMRDHGRAAGAPVNDSAVPRGAEKPEGALMRSPDEKGTEARKPPSEPLRPGGTPGAATPGPGTPKNRDMTLETLPTLPGAPRQARS